MQKLYKILLATIIICLIAPLSFRVDGILITLQTFILFMVAGTLGKEVGLYASLLYLLAGALGLPVFGGYSSGWERLIGNTAGFLWGFPISAYLLGLWCEKQERNFLNYIKNFFLAHIILIALGFTVLKIMEPGVLLFQTFQKLIPGLILKTIVGGLLSHYLLKRFPSLGNLEH